MRTVILDNGHGANTPGKRSPIWNDGTQLLEYKFNRDIVQRIAKKLNALEIPHNVLVHEEWDVSLRTRVTRANHFFKYHKDAFLVSVHANGGGGTGWEAWTSLGETFSDKIASVFYDKAQVYFPEQSIRTDHSDGDIDKESNFYILRHTHCPAVLTENFFMDTWKDYLLITDNSFRDTIADMHVATILAVQDI